MAFLHNSLLAGKLRGLFGKEIVFRKWGNKTIVAKAPKRRKEHSPLQLQGQYQFLLGTHYAKAVMKNSSLKDAYVAALKPGQNVFARAISDFRNPPVVNGVDANNYAGKIGNPIAIRAVDDFRVTGVEVEIYSACGALLEKGLAAVQMNGLDWIYITTQPNDTLAGTRIKATATDLPGNQGMREITL